MGQIDTISNNPTARLNPEQFAALFQGLQNLEKSPPHTANFPGAEEAPLDLPPESQITGIRELGISHQGDIGKGSQGYSGFSTIA